MTANDVRRWRIIMWLFIGIAVVSIVFGEYQYALGCLIMSAVYGVGSGILQAVLRVDDHETLTP